WTAQQVEAVEQAVLERLELAEDREEDDQDGRRQAPAVPLECGEGAVTEHPRHSMLPSPQIGRSEWRPRAAARGSHLAVASRQFAARYGTSTIWPVVRRASSSRWASAAAARA